MVMAAAKAGGIVANSKNQKDFFFYFILKFKTHY